ncbi:MAG: hypothetical protein AAB954_01345 [Patescibacteria group bacterium]
MIKVNNYQDLNESQKEELKKIALARVQVMPRDLNVSVGSESMNKNELIKHINEGDGIGESLMLTELEFLRDLASGAIYANE